LNQSSRWGRLEEFDRYLFTFIIVHADDQGRMNAAPAYMKSIALPWSEASPQKILAALQRLSTEKYITLYECDRDELLQINDWWTMQSLSWAHPSNLAPPPNWTDRLKYQDQKKVVMVNWDTPGGFLPDNETPRNEQLDEEMPNDKGDGIGSELGSGLGSGLGSELGSGLGSELGSGLGSELGSGLGGGLTKLNLTKPNLTKLNLTKPNLTKLESSSSSSSKSGGGAKTFDDDDDDEAAKNKKVILALLKAAGISAKNQKAVLKMPKIQLADVLAELAWCHNSRVSNVSKPHVIAPMNLLKGDFPDATCYSGTYWEQHIPSAILSKAELAKYVQEKAHKERGENRGLDDYPLAEFYMSDPVDVKRPDIPDKHWQFWQSSKNQLQLDMPKSSFDAWVKDMQLVSTKDNKFTFTVKNSYARDWLASRIKPSLDRLLTGSLGEKTSAVFVVENS
ncbi:MAG: hypothetical protein DRI56_13740, partial [Chloroflexota bacterium]